MALVSNTTVQSSLKEYSLELYKYPHHTLNADGSIPEGTLLTAEVHEVVQTSDASPGSLTFMIGDDDTTVYQDAGSIETPDISDEIVLKATDVADSTLKVIFKGIVTNISHRRNNSGSFYNVQCLDMKTRLADDCITKTYNEQYDNASKPNFSEKDELLHEEKFTVYEIIEDIMEMVSGGQIFSFTSSYTPVTWFDFSNLDFSEAGDELTSFIPNTLVFTDISVLEAIYRVVNSAGSYRMVYNPQTDKIVFTKVSLDADNCGSLRSTVYATASSDLPNHDYVNDVNVLEDNSVYRITDLATVFRAYGGEAEFYTGHFFLDKDHRSFDMTPNESGSYYLSNFNWDGYPYWFDTVSLSNISPSGHYIVVGCPLYPQWNPLKGYNSYKTELGYSSVTKYEKETSTEGFWTSSHVTNEYDGLRENQGFCKVDRDFPFETDMEKYVDHDSSLAFGYVYEAWFPWAGECAYCQGSGAVEDASSWSGYEDSWFGNSRNSDGTPNRPMLTPFDYNFITYNGELIPQNHPVPWENTCPACRGMGREPKYKIRHIQNSLINLPPSEIRIEEAAANAAENRTWEEVMRDLGYSHGPQIQMERNFTKIGDEKFEGHAPEYGGSKPAHPLAGVESLTGPSVKIFPDDQKIGALYRTYIEPCVKGASIDYHRGNITFDSREGISCIKQIRPIEKDRHSGKSYFFKNTSGETIYNTEVGSFMSYWRPARAWISCYFKDDLFWTNVSNGSDVITIDGHDYNVKFGVRKGRPVFEVYRDDPDPEVEFMSRPVIKSSTIGEYRWQVYPDDLEKYPVPTVANYSWIAPSGNLYEYINRNYYFPRGCAHILETLKIDELPNTGFELSDVGRSDVFPKRYDWVQKDDRYNLIKRAARELEKRNDIQVSGNVIVRGCVYNLSNGFGYVQLDSRKACIVKMVHTFRGGYKTTLELTTEEFRIGEELEDEKDTKTLLDEKINKQLFKSFGTIRDSSVSSKNRSKRKSHLTSDNGGDIFELPL